MAGFMASDAQLGLTEGQAYGQAWRWGYRGDWGDWGWAIGAIGAIGARAGQRSWPMYKSRQQANDKGG